MKTLNVTFVPGDRVKIDAIDTIGRVVSVWYGSHGTKYEVAYFNNGERREVFMRDYEITAKD